MATREQSLIGSIGKGVGGYFPGSEAVATRANTIPLLRQQQGEFGAVREELDRENAWKAIPILAPEAAVSLAGLGTLAALRYAKPIPPGPLVIQKMGFRGGNSWQAKAGNGAHKALRDKGRHKKDWDADPEITGPDGKKYRPDLRAPQRKPEDARKLLELKPDTPSGIRAGKRQARLYEQAVPPNQKPNKVRIIRYNPKDYI